MNSQLVNTGGGHGVEQPTSSRRPSPDQANRMSNGVRLGTIEGQGPTSPNTCRPSTANANCSRPTATVDPTTVTDPQRHHPRRGLPSTDSSKNFAKLGAQRQHLPMCPPPLVPEKLATRAVRPAPALASRPNGSGSTTRQRSADNGRANNGENVERTGTANTSATV